MEDKVNMRSTYQSYALSAAAFLAGGVILRLLASFIFHQAASPEVYEKWKVSFSFISDMVFLYIVAFGLFHILNRKKEMTTPEQNKVSAGKFLLWLLILFGFNGFGVLAGSIVNRIVTNMIGVSTQTGETIQSLSLGSSVVLRILVLGIIAPVVEEIVFRKVLVDRTLKYGEWASILASALMYALFQGGFSLFFYALLMGGFLAYIYIRTGKVWVVIALHMVMNLFNYVLTFFMEKFANAEALAQIEAMTEEYAETKDVNLLVKMEEISQQIKPQLIVYTVWTYVVGGICIAGIIVWIVLLIKQKFKLQYTEQQVFRGAGIAVGNIGMLVYFLCAVGLFVMNYIILAMG